MVARHVEPGMTREGVERLAAVINEMEESLKDSDFPKQDPPATGRRHLSPWRAKLYGVAPIKPDTWRWVNELE